MPHSRLHSLALTVALSSSFLAGCKAKDHDPRTEAPLVLISQVPPAQPASQIFTGVVAARVQAPLGFRVGGKIIARYVDRGQIVHRGDLLMKLDPADFETAVNVQSAVVEADEANLREAEIDAQRYAKIVDSGAVSRQVYTTAANAFRWLALAAVLAFIPPNSSVFWGSMAYNWRYDRWYGAHFAVSAGTLFDPVPGETKRGAFVINKILTVTR
jgi:multidrug efflux pump subunit AcrA (membrane-fusion protein)